MSKYARIACGAVILCVGLLIAAVVTPVAGYAAESSPASLLTTAGTSVGGIISASTTWTAEGSPYVLNTDLQIAQEATLTIEPGVEVVGSSAYEIRTYGALVAVGQSDNRIQMRDVRIEASNNDYKRSCLIELRQCVLTGGSVYPATGNAVYGSLTLTDSRIEYPNDLTHLWYPQKDCRIERNVFLGSCGISIGTSASHLPPRLPVNVYIRNNIFCDWRFAFGSYGGAGFGIQNWAAYDGGMTYVNGNTFYPPAASLGPKYILEVPAGYTSAKMDGTGNYWVGMPAPQSFIHDKTNDLACASVIQFAPTLPGPAADTPVFALISIKGATITGVPAYAAYEGGPCMPSPVVAIEGRRLAEGRDYSVSYANNTARGTATVNITGKGIYTDSVNQTFVILGITPMDKSIYVGRSTTLRVVGGSGGTTWRSSNRKVATVSSTGVVKGVGAGTATISATRNGVRTSCDLTVRKYSYQLSLSRSVAGGKGYLNAKVKTASGKPAKGRTVKFYRGGAYLGKATTNSEGKAKLKVSKSHSFREYRIRVTGNTVYATTSATRTLAFLTKVFDKSAIDLFSTSKYLKVGTYKLVVTGDGSLSASAAGHRAAGSSGASTTFEIGSSGYYSVSGISWTDGGRVRVVIYRWM